jgi:hypothetical protein
LLALAGAFCLQGCVAPQPNPEFRSCANTCSKRQDDCMVNASTSGQIDRCNTSQNACVAACDKKYPRYLN